MMKILIEQLKMVTEKDLNDTKKEFVLIQNSIENFKKQKNTNNDDDELDMLNSELLFLKEKINDIEKNELKKLTNALQYVMQEQKQIKI